MLQGQGFKSIRINPNGPEYKSLAQAVEKEGRPHTITIYVSPTISSAIAEEILKSQPTRVIFNPGTENRELINKLNQAGIEVVEGCTLIMLKTGQF